MKYFKGTIEEYRALNKAISDQFKYPDHGTESYYTDDPNHDVDGKCVMQIDGFIQDMMPEVFAGIELHDTVTYPENETEL